MRGIDRPTLIFFWTLIFIMIGIQIRAGTDIMLVIMLACLLAIVLLTAGIEIPVARKRMRKPSYTMETVHLLEEMYSIPLERDFSDRKRFFETIVTINLGGFVIPLATACYLGVTHPDVASIEIGIVMIAVTHVMASFRDGVGIRIPSYIGIFPLALALLLAPDEVAYVAFAAGVSGILIGLCTVLGATNTERHGSARISIGGAGNFKAVYITMLLAVLIDALMRTIL